MTSDERWTLDPEHEEQYLSPWLASEDDPKVRERVLKYVAEVVGNPIRAHLEDHDERTGEPLGVFSVQIPETNVGMIWLLDHENRSVVLTGLGPV